jgi:hypothetical protein
MHGHPRHALAARQFQHRHDVLLVAVHAAGRQQPEHVQGRLIGLGRRAGRA